MEYLNSTISQLGKLLPIIGISCIIWFGACEKQVYSDDSLDPNSNNFKKDTDTTIYITDDIIVDDRVKVKDPYFNYYEYENFLSNLQSSGKFLFTTMDEFRTTNSNDKIIIALRHDIDYSIESAVKFARREYKLGIRSSYYFLHTADYYGSTKEGCFIRDTTVLSYMKKIQDEYKHEIGWHNDLVTLKLIYKIEPVSFLVNELNWLRKNDIVIKGTSYHGSQYCYIYKYGNPFFWKEYYPNGVKPVFINGKYVDIEQSYITDFGFTYEAGLIRCSHFFSDSYFVKDKRWHFNDFNWQSLQPGDKVIILTHSAFWD